MSQILYVPKIGQRADLQHPINKGCVGWWPLTDGAGGVAIDLMRGNNGTQSGGVSWADTEKGKAASFDGTDDYFACNGFIPVAGTGALSFSAWFNTTTTSTQNTVASYGANASGESFQIEIENGVAWSRNVSSTANGGSGLNNGRWHHLAWTKPSGGTISGVRMFIDGQELALTTSGTDTLNFGTTLGLEIGNRSLGNPDPVFNGLLSNLRFWSRELDHAEIYQLYTQPWIGLAKPSNTRYFLPLSIALPITRTFSIAGGSASLNGGIGRVSIRKGV